MDLAGFYLAHPFWAWVAAAAVFLAVEVATGTTYLLWPAAAAGVVALLAALQLPPGIDAAVFAVLTIALTLVGRRYVRRMHDGPDINDPKHRLIGRRGAAAGAFERGEGRVFVDGKEWAAELDGEGALTKGDPIEVQGVLDGGRLKVRAI